MIGGFAAVSEATAAVHVAGRRVGSAVLVDDRHLLTAGHLFRATGPERGGADGTRVVFPLVGAASVSSIGAVSLALEPHREAVDLAVLQLGSTPRWLPPPVPVSGADRLPRRVGVFGFPLAEKRLSGVWREFAVSGPLARGEVQLDWLGRAGTLRGHSGGPVVDSVSGELVGVLLAGSEKGGFDRFLPVAVIPRRWPGLRRRWVMSSDARSSFARGARGQAPTGLVGDFFQGRVAALEAVRRALTHPDPSGRLLAIIGQPGAGKSSVLARCALALEREGVGPGLALVARGSTYESVVDGIAQLTGVAASQSAPDLVATVAASEPNRPWLVAVDGLDEVHDVLERRRIAALLAELASLPSMRVVVATRPLATRGGHRPSGLLAELAIDEAAGDDLVDLDSERYADRPGMVQYVAALLAQRGVNRPGPRGAAWGRYRDDPGLRDDLAAAIVARAGLNYLVAALAAVALSRRRGVIDPRAPDFDAGSIPSSIGQALTKFLDPLPPSERTRVRGLLTALAYARGSGVVDALWLRMANALGYDATYADLDGLRDSAAVDYVLQGERSEAGAGSRLFHQALIDELVGARDRRRDEGAIFEALVHDVHDGRDREWRGYVREHLPAHALAAGRVDDLILDPALLLLVSPRSMRRSIPAASSDEAQAVGQAYELVSHTLDVERADVGQDRTAAAAVQPKAASLLQLAARQVGADLFADQVMDVTRLPWSVPWAIWRRLPRHRVVARHGASISAVTTGTFGNALVVVAADVAGEVQAWRMLDGSRVGEARTGPGDLLALAMCRGGEDEQVITVHADGRVRSWSPTLPRSDQELRQLLPAGIAAAAVEELGGEVVVVAGSTEGALHAQPAYESGRPLPPQRAHAAHRVSHVVAARVGRRRLLISGADDARIAIADIDTGELISHSSRSVHAGIAALAVGFLSRDAPCLVGVGGDGTVNAWDLRTGRKLAWSGTKTSFGVIATGDVDGEGVVVTTVADDSLEVWRLDDGSPVCPPLVALGHTASSVAIAADGRKRYVVAGAADGAVRAWPLTRTPSSGAPEAGPRLEDVVAIATGETAGLQVVAAASRKGRCLVVDARSGTEVGQPLPGERYEHHRIAVCVARVGVLVAWFERPGQVRVTHVPTREAHDVAFPTDDFSISESLALGVLRGAAVAAVGREDGVVDVYAVDDGELVARVEAADGRGVASVELREELLVSTGWDRSTRLWDIASQGILRELRPPAPSGALRLHVPTALGTIGGRVTVAIARGDGGASLYDVDERRLDVPEVGDAEHVSTLAIGGGVDGGLVVIGTLDGNVEVWDVHRARHAELLVRTNLGAPVRSAAVSDRREVYVGTVGGVAAVALGHAR